MKIRSLKKYSTKNCLRPKEKNMNCRPAEILPLKTFFFYLDIADLRGQVLGISEAAVNKLGNAVNQAGARQFSSAGENFTQAGEYFSQAQEDVAAISKLLGILALIVPQNDIRLAAQA